MAIELIIESSEIIAEDAAQLECLLPAVARRLFTLDEAAEMPVAQLRVCSILQSGARSMSSLSEELNISVSAVTQIADRLEKTGLVERVAESGDRRMRNLTLTEFGRQLMSKRRAARVARISRILRDMPREEREGILRSLRALLEASGSVASPSPDATPYSMIDNGIG
jgi:DNA-binding MarR family transcriptional regulator